MGFFKEVTGTRSAVKCDMSGLPLQGARNAEVAGARLASALGILSYPVMTNELLRLTTYLHARNKQRGRLGKHSLINRGLDMAGPT